MPVKTKTPNFSEITETTISMMEEEDLSVPLKLSSDENESIDIPIESDKKDDDVKGSIFQKMEMNFMKVASGSVSEEKVDVQLGPDKEDQDSANIQGKTVGLRPRRERSRGEANRETARARKSIGRSLATVGKAAQSSTPTRENSPTGPKGKTNSKMQDSLKARKKRKFKGGTYSLFLSKKKRTRQSKSPRKDSQEQKNSGDEEEYDSDDESVSVTDSMMTVDSFQDDENEMQLDEEFENVGGFQEDDDEKPGGEILKQAASEEVEKSPSEVLSTENEAQEEKVNAEDQVSSEKKENEATKTSAEVNLSVDDDASDRDTEDEDAKASDELDVSSEKEAKVDDDDAKGSEEVPKSSENGVVGKDEAHEPKMDAEVGPVEDEKDESVEIKVEKESEIKEVLDENTKVDSEEKAIKVETPEKSDKSEQKKGGLKLLLRPGFKSLLKAGSRSSMEAKKVDSSTEVNGAKVESVESGAENGLSNQNEEFPRQKKLIIADVSEQADESMPNLDENQNVPDGNKENFGFMDVLSNMTIETPRSLGDGKSSIATSVKGRQRIKKVMEDHIDVDNVSISSSVSDSDSLHHKKSTPSGIGTLPSLNGVIGSPMLNGTSPLLSKLPPIHHDGFLKKITTCLCSSKSTVTSTIGVEKAANGSVFCQAVDAMYGRIVACCNSVSVSQMHRPSVRIPFMYMCELHRHRLRTHQCCPGCGLFCTQGIVLQCRSNPKSIHHFHKRCTVHANEQALCPHCGKSSKFREVKLELNTPQPLNFYLSREPVAKFPRAKMTVCRSEESVKDPIIERMKNTPYKSFHTKNKHVISSSTFPLGPEREQLQSLLSNLHNQDLLSLRHTHKNMLTACQKQEHEKFLQIIATGLDPNYQYEEVDNDTCLHIACRLGNLILVHIIIQAGASVNIMNNDLKPPLFGAIENGHNSVVNHLIKAGADLDLRGEEGTTALHVASVHSNFESCKLILNTGVRPNLQDDGGWSSLVWAAEHGHFEIAKLLLERGADPYLQDTEQNIALHWSAYSGSVDISQLFLDHGCPLNTVNVNGDTPLHIAARQEKYECVVLFLARQADVNAQNKANDSPMDCCLNKESQTFMALSMSKDLQKLRPNTGPRGDKVVHRDISQGKEQYPIQCVNSVDEELLPTNYLYVIQNCETSPINIDRTITSLQSCDCEDDCTSTSCKCVQISLKCWYDKEGRLLPDFNFLDPPMLFECNRACKCWRNQCNNRVVQDGIVSRLQLFRTKDKGWGVKTLRDIPRGSFVCEYIGELMSDFEADQREDDSYLFDLDNRDGETYCIDARYYGNISRFINHLCEPNVVPVKVFVDHQDLSFPRIAFFSSRDIKAHEELGFDYGEKFWMIKYKWFTCTCSSPKCKYSKDSIQTTLENYNRRMNDDHLQDQVKKASTIVNNDSLNA